MAIDLKVPQAGESIKEVQIADWLKKEGDSVERDENVATLESEKATVDLPAPEAGVIAKIIKKKGATVKVGETIARIETNGKAEKSKKTGKKEADESGEKKLKKSDKKYPEEAKEKKSEKAEGAEKEKPSADRKEKKEGKGRVMPAARRLLAEHDLDADEVEATGPGGRLLKEDVQRHLEEREKEPEVAEEKEAPEPPRKAPGGDREEEVVPMSPLRRTVARRLVEAQRTMAMLTTFNEADLSAVMELRKEFQEAFQEKYKVKLGFMSFFVKAVIDALKEIPQLNAEVRDDNIVFHNYYDIGVAIGGGKGLVVPVIRNAERLSFAEIEQVIGDFGRRAKENKLKPEELQGGTFTISNGGVYGSLLSTPIVNPPQSGILGMHAIQDRPVARDGNVVIRPMMNLALSYDHRIVDGREAVTFLKRVKEVVEQPPRMLIEI